MNIGIMTKFWHRDPVLAFNDVVVVLVMNNREFSVERNCVLRRLIIVGINHKVNKIN